ncbi:MAG: DUF3224 domain-containing protein [Thermomicrobiales bacterium]|nr:DUF3224 domain-containing protein [Thermomicrobiales bacterium]
MLERASGQFTIDGNVEDIFGGIAGAARIARISQTCQLRGQLEGESIAEFTAVLPPDGNGSFHGFQRISGALGEREGTFVLSVTGEIVKGQPRGSWTIVPKSGSGDFAHIRGEGRFSLPDGKPGSYELAFDLRKPRTRRQPIDVDSAPSPTSLETVPARESSEVAAGAVPPTKSTRKPRAKKSETPIEPAIDSTPKRHRTAAPKKTSTPSAEPAPAKRSRTRKTTLPAPEATVETEPTPTSKPKRSRKAATKPEIESKPAVTPAPAETAPKRSRGKQSLPPDPIPLSAKAVRQQRRRTKAA